MNNPSIRIVNNNKKEFLPLLLLGDELESDIEKYLERGDLFALYDGDLKSVCVVTDEGGGVLEIQNLATDTHYQRQGYAARLVNHVANHYAGRYEKIILGTGDVPGVLSFYEKCGFSITHSIADYFTTHFDYPIIEDGIVLKDKVYLERRVLMITYKQVDRTYFPQYDQIPMLVHVSSYYRIEKINRGLGGFHLVETPVEPYIKDFCTGDDESVTRWDKRWDISNWAFFMAFDGKRPVGAAAVVTCTKEINMLSGRDDLAVLWDIRVDDAYKHQGIGQALFDMAVKWSREQGIVQMKIECQNNNIPAVKFYHKQGAVLSAINEYAYYNEPENRHETQLIWMLDL